MKTTKRFLPQLQSKSVKIINGAMVETNLTKAELCELKELIACEFPINQKAANSLLAKGWIENPEANEGSYFIKNHLIKLAENQ